MARSTTGLPPPQYAAATRSHSPPFLMHAHAASAVLHLILEPIFRYNSSCIVSNPSGRSELVKFIVNDGKDKDDNKYCTCWLPSISSRVFVMFFAGTGTLCTSLAALLSLPQPCSKTLNNGGV
jgi:hypothetical protein